jgi:hypothetical protein
LVRGKRIKIENLKMTRTPKTRRLTIVLHLPAISRPIKSKTLKFKKQKTGKKYFSGNQSVTVVGWYIETRVGNTAIVMAKVIDSDPSSNQMSRIISVYDIGGALALSGSSG